MNALLAEGIFNEFVSFQQLYLFLPIKQQVHAQACVDWHALEKPLVRASDGDEIADMVLLGQGLELWDDLVQPLNPRVGRSMDGGRDVTVPLGGMGVLYELSECMNDDLLVYSLEVVRVDVLDRLDDLDFFKRRHIGDNCNVRLIASCWEGEFLTSSRQHCKIS